MLIIDVHQRQGVVGFSGRVAVAAAITAARGNQKSRRSDTREHAPLGAHAV